MTAAIATIGHNMPPAVAAATAAADYLARCKALTITAAALEAATAAPAQVRAEGIRARGLRTVWDVEITDPVALVNALATHPAVQEAAANVAAVRARVDKAAFSLPGCKAVAREVL